MAEVLKSMVALRRFRKTSPSFSDLTPYTGLVDGGVLLLKDGSLMAGWYFAGPDAESSTNLERNEISRQINAVRGGSVCLNSFGRFVEWISASFMPPPSSVPAR